MVELNQTLNGEAEELAYAKHCFIQLYGSSATDWEFRLNHDHAGDQQLASAANALFLQNIRAAFARANVKLESIQPYLMAAYNNCHSDLQNQDARLNTGVYVSDWSGRVTGAVYGLSMLEMTGMRS